MSETESQMLEARCEFIAMLRSAAPFLALCLSLIFAFEMWFFSGFPLGFLGAMAGCTYALLNLCLLFWFLAPFFFFRQKPVYVLSGVFISLSVGGVLMYVATLIGPRWAIGFALGLASPAIIGALHSLQIETTSKTLKGKNIPLDLH